jgi:hypothetical protein
VSWNDGTRAVRTLFVVGAKTRRTIGSGVLALVSLAGLSACSDEGSTVPAVSESEYRDTAAELCERQGSSLLEASELIDQSTMSDADLASYLTAEYIPRVRAILRGVLRGGLPPERAADYQEGINLAVEGLNELEDAPYSWIDRTRAGTILPEEDGMRKILDGLEAADLGDC